MRQGELFCLEPKAKPQELVIAGFKLIENYVSGDEEQFYLEQIEHGPWQQDFRRRIQQYGLGYGGEQRSKPIWVRDLPEWLLPLAERVARDAPLERFPENCVINEYIPPLGIGPHRDYPDFGPAVACLSLSSDIVMDFRNPEGNLKQSVFVPARSFWVISGPARWQWTHGIAARLTDLIQGERRIRSRRVSITFRTSKDGEALKGR